jgi:formate-dependent nitrite reductase cytochrome c552 subunit
MKGKTPFSPDDPSKVTLDTFPCFKCHLPQAVTSGTDAFAKDYAKALLAQDKTRIGKLSITCIVCHNTKAIVHKLSEGHPEKGVLYGTKAVTDHGDKMFKTVKKSSIMDHAIMCGQCHGQGKRALNIRVLRVICLPRTGMTWKAQRNFSRNPFPWMSRLLGMTGC